MPHTIAEMRALAEQWMAAWNAGDLAGSWITTRQMLSLRRIRSFVVGRKPTANSSVSLNEHFQLGLELVPNLHFELEDMFSAPSGYAVLYRRENGNRVLDVVELDDEGKARRVKAFYAAEQN